MDNVSRRDLTFYPDPTIAYEFTRFTVMNTSTDGDKKRTSKEVQTVIDKGVANPIATIQHA
jgi:hypothetical protein